MLLPVDRLRVHLEVDDDVAAQRLLVILELHFDLLGAHEGCVLAQTLLVKVAILLVAHLLLQEQSLLLLEMEVLNSLIVLSNVALVQLLTLLLLLLVLLKGGGAARGGGNLGRASYARPRLLESSVVLLLHDLQFAVLSVDVLLLGLESLHQLCVVLVAIGKLQLLFTADVLSTQLVMLLSGLHD